MKSAFLNLHWKDLLKGFIVAVVGAILTALYTVLEAGQLPANWDEWKPMLIGGLAAGIAYLLKNLFTNSNDELLKPE